MKVWVIWMGPKASISIIMAGPHRSRDVLSIHREPERKGGGGERDARVDLTEEKWFSCLAHNLISTDQPTSCQEGNRFCAGIGTPENGNARSPLLLFAFHSCAVHVSKKFWWWPLPLVAGPGHLSPFWWFLFFISWFQTNSTQEQLLRERAHAIVNLQQQVDSVNRQLVQLRGVSSCPSKNKNKKKKKWYQPMIQRPPWFKYSYPGKFNAKTISLCHLVSSLLRVSRIKSCETNWKSEIVFVLN